MADVQEFKCPRCGGKLEFDAAGQTMKCPYCDSTFDPESLRRASDNATAGPADAPAAGEEAAWEPAGQNWTGAEESAVQTYVCKSCGGEILSEETTAATACPFCGNPVVLAGRVSGTLKPDYVIPFKLNRQQAMDKLREFVKGKRFTPRFFASENRLQEIRGLYVPFWLFDSDVSAAVEFDATTTRRWSDSDYDYVETSHYDVLRSGTMRFENIPVDGSKKMADDLMDSLEPFFMDDAVDFQTAYLSGFLADKYDVTMEQSMPRANARTKASAKAALHTDLGKYTSVIPKSENVQIVPGKAKYALFPVWLLNTSYHGKTYTFAMNGQTGRFIGNLPISKSKLAGLFVGVAAGVSAVTFLAGLLAGLF
ncbi:MAG: hypothetical protein II621_04480 [Clostridia bacterium]|nr:hypothetical protein [Clostridia bacterium]MBQ4365412.1 hypothetical protein [Clostridia bacterium]